MCIRDSISPSQQNYITNSNAGEGLIFYGSTIVPFKDDFPKDTQDVYKRQVLNTADTRQKLENDVFWAAGIAQKYNCSLVHIHRKEKFGWQELFSIFATVIC